MSLFTDFDHYDLPIGPDHTPFEFIEALRDEALKTGNWIHWSERHGGFWVVAGWEEFRDILRDYETFSNRVMTLPAFTTFNNRPMMLDGYNPPEHTRYRKVLQAPFSPASAAAMAESLRADTNYLIDQFIDEGNADLGAGLAAKVGGRMTAMICGLPPENGDVYRSWVWAMAQGTSRGAAGTADLIRDFETSFHDLLEKRRAQPGDDIVSGITHSEVDGEMLTDEEVMDFFAVLLIA